MREIGKQFFFEREISGSTALQSLNGQVGKGLLKKKLLKLSVTWHQNNTKWCCFLALSSGAIIWMKSSSVPTVKLTENYQFELKH